MSDINTVCISGRLGRELNKKYFESGAKKVTLSIGVNSYNTKTQKEEVTWHKAIAWNKKAEFIIDVAQKGAMVVVQGTLQKDTYYDTENIQRSDSYILINEIKIVNPRQTDTDGQ